MTSAKPKLPTKPLPLADILRDLAVLRRSSGHDIPELFKIPVTRNGVSSGANAADASSSHGQVDSSVSLSYGYVREARAAIRLHDSGKIEMQGARIEEARTKYEALMNALDG